MPRTGRHRSRRATLERMLRSGLDGVVMNACQNNTVVKKVMSTRRTSRTTRQESDFVDKLKKDLDK